MCNYNDIYIKCANGIKITHAGGNVLKVYIPSITRGHNIIKNIFYSLGESDEVIYEDICKALSGFLLDIDETDLEVIFKVKDKNLKKIISFLKPSISGASIRPFSSKNLPRKKVLLSTAQIHEYKQITDEIPQKDKLLISKINSDFLTQNVCKKLRINIFQAKSEMKRECIRVTDYFFLKGMWKEYLQYLKKEVETRVTK